MKHSTLSLFDRKEDKTRAKADGSLLFDTKVDTDGVKKGMEQTGTVAKVALGTVLGHAVEKAATGVAELGKAAIQVGSNFETAMSQVAATMGITTDEIAAGSDAFEMLSEKAKEMGASTKFTATEAAEGLNILAMAGLSAEEACTGIDTVLSLAAAGAMSLDQAATYVTGSVKAFSDNMDNASYYADLMAKGATLANTNVQALGEAMVGVGATAASYGQTADGLTLSLLRLAEQNITGSEAATAMNRAMMDLYTPTSTAKTELDKLGVSVYDANGNAREFNTVVDELKDALSGMSQEEANATKNAIFTTFGLQAFNKMTVTSTEKVQSFKEGLAEASGSAMQQMETQTDNLQGKITIFGSACEAVGVSVYEVFEDMMKDGVDDATKAMDRLNKSIKSGNLGASLNKLSKAIGNFADKAIDAGEDALPVMIDGLTWILENGDLVISAIVGIETATFTMGTIVPVIKAASDAWVAYKAKNEGATISQWLLNEAMLANPAGILLSAVLGLTAAVAMYSLTCEDVTEAESEITKQTKEEIEASKELNSALSDSKKAREESVEAMAATEKNVKEYIQQLDNLTKKENKTAEDKAKIQNIVDKLNASVEGLNLTYDAEADALNMTNGELERNTDVLLENMKVAAAREDLEQITKDQYEAEKQLRKEEELLGEQQRELTRLQYEATQEAKKHVDAAGNMVDVYTEIDGKVDNAITALDDLKAQHENTKQSVEDLGKEYLETLEYIDQGEATLEQAKESTNEFGESITEVAGEVDEAYSEMAESVYDSVEKAISIFDAWDASTSASKETLQKNLDSQVAGLTEWGDNLESLATRTDVAVNQEFLAYLAQLGPSAAGEIATLASMTSQELEAYQTKFAEAMTLPGEITNQIMESYTKAGEATTKGYTTGQTTEMAKGEPEKNAKEMAKNSTDASEKQLEISNGKSAVVEKQGEALPAGLAEGVKEKEEVATKQMKDTADAVVKTAEDNLDEDTFKKLGETMGQAFADGLKAGLDSAVSAASEAAAQIVDAMSSAKECVAGYEEGGGDGQAPKATKAPGTTTQSINSFAAASMSVQSAGMQAVQVQTNVSLEGDAAGVFRVVEQENNRIYNSTGYLPLAKK